MTWRISNNHHANTRADSLIFNEWDLAFDLRTHAPQTCTHACVHMHTLVHIHSHIRTYPVHTRTYTRAHSHTHALLIVQHSLILAEDVHRLEKHVQQNDEVLNFNMRVSDLCSANVHLHGIILKSPKWECKIAGWIDSYILMIKIKIHSFMLWCLKSMHRWTSAFKSTMLHICTKDVQQNSKHKWTNYLPTISAMCKIDILEITFRVRRTSPRVVGRLTCRKSFHN